MRVYLFVELMIFCQGFTDEQNQAVTFNKQRIQTRLTDIKQIARSLNEINQMFQEMHMMIVEQG
jgi:t-SNARE complex subunit (syntaxin)